MGVVLNIFILFLSLVVSFIIGLIIFIYFSAIQPNQRLYFKSLFLSAVFFFFFTPLYLYPIVIDLFLDEEEDLIHISFLFNLEIFPVLFILGVFLFVALVVVSKVS